MATRLKIKTTEGDVTIRLYDETPKHRDNFLKLVKEEYFNGTIFHRVIKDFMIQGGQTTPSLRSLFIHNTSTNVVP